MTTPTPATPLVRRLAAEHGVDLAQIQGTGVAGRITKNDVMAAGAWPQAIKDAVARGAISRDRVPAYEAMARQNPRAAVDLMAQLPGSPAGARMAEATSTPLPPFTASGVDPTVLLQVPPSVREALAATPSRAVAYELVRDYAGMDDAIARDRILMDPRGPDSWFPGGATMGGLGDPEGIHEGIYDVDGETEL